MSTLQSVGSWGLMDTRSLRRPSRPPTAADWAYFRELVVELYQHQEQPLRQVRSFMEHTHGFIAS